MKPLAYQYRKQSDRLGIVHYHFRNDQYHLVITADKNGILFPLELKAVGVNSLVIPDITITENTDGILTFPLGIQASQSETVAAYLHPIPDILKSVKQAIALVCRMQRKE